MKLCMLAAACGVSCEMEARLQAAVQRSGVAGAVVLVAGSEQDSLWQHALGLRDVSARCALYCRN